MNGIGYCLEARSGQPAYRVSVEFGRLGGLDYTGMRGAGAASGWRCDRSALTCTGTLPAGASGRIYLSGRLPATMRPGRLYTLTARAVVTGASQLHGTPSKTASATVAVHAAPPAPAGSSGLPLLAVAVAGFLLGGGLLVGFTLRRRPARAAGTRARAPGTSSYQGQRRRVTR